ncbi:MAG: hypothetical protein O3C40_21325 [Planctomycetota bacterium]|nr:hypothetical protein [Planctomycetota bacterium]
MNVERVAPFVRLGDAGDFQIPVKHLHQLSRHVEQRRIGCESPALPLHRDNAGGFQFRRSRIGLTLEPSPQIVRQIGPYRDLSPAASFLIRSVQYDHRVRRVQTQVADGHRSEFAPAQSRQCQRLVDQCPLLPASHQLGNERWIVFQPSPCPFTSGVEFVERQRRRLPSITFAFHVGFVFGDGFAAVLGKWSNRCNEQQPLQFGRQHRSAVASLVGVFIRAANFRQRIDQQPSLFNAPVAEPAHGLQITVARSRCHAGGLSLNEPTLHRFAGDLTQASESAVALQHVEP